MDCGLVSPDTYNYNLSCGNCNCSAGLRVPLGITLEKYAQDHDCPNCGCKLLGKDNQPYAHRVITPMLYLPYSLWRGQ